MQEIKWEHSIRLSDRVTDGRIHVETEKWVSQAIPVDLNGKTVLDIGAWDGYYSFLCEQRGAEVTAIEVNPKHKRGFDLAKKILDSHVDYRLMSVYELDQLPSKFDCVLFFGVIYHLYHPMLALEKIREKCRGKMILETSCIFSQSPTMRFVWEENPDPSTYWRFSPNCLKGMCKLAGFRDSRVVAKRWFLPWRRGRVLMEAIV